MYYVGMFIGYLIMVWPICFFAYAIWQAFAAGSKAWAIASIGIVIFVPCYYLILREILFGGV